MKRAKQIMFVLAVFVTVGRAMCVDEDNLVATRVNSNSCSMQAGCNLIETVEDCSRAGNELGLGEVGVRHNEFELNEGRIPGCFHYEAETYSVMEFNFRVDDNSGWNDHRAKAVCYCSNPTASLVQNSCSSAPGCRLIRSVDECSRAGNELGLGAVGVRHNELGSTGGRIPGCFHYKAETYQVMEFNFDLGDISGWNDHRATPVCYCEDTDPSIQKNIERVMQGYDVMRGDPFPVLISPPLDPGFKAPIFEVTYNENRKSADGRFCAPDNSLIFSCDGTCSEAMSTAEVMGTRSYQESLNTMTTVTGEGYGASFSASAGYQRTFSDTNDNRRAVQMTSGSCCAYTIVHDPDSESTFTQSFIETVQHLPEHYDEFLYANFVSVFGTHYIQTLNMGAMMMQRATFEAENFARMTSENFNFAAAAEFAIKGFTIGFDTSTETEESMARTFQSESTELVINTLGARIPGDGRPWQDVIADDMQPISHTLVEITSLLTGRFASVYGLTTAGVDARRNHLLYYLREIYCRIGGVQCSGPGPDPIINIAPLPQGQIIDSYWDNFSCGPSGNDANRGLCHNGRDECDPTVQTGLCASGVAEIFEQKRYNVDEGGCHFFWKAKFRCRVDPNMHDFYDPVCPAECQQCSSGDPVIGGIPTIFGQCTGYCEHGKCGASASFTDEGVYCRDCSNNIGTSLCPLACSECQSGEHREGGARLFAGTCLDFCSFDGFCGTTDPFKSVYCRGCARSGAAAETAVGAESIQSAEAAVGAKSIQSLRHLPLALDTADEVVQFPNHTDSFMFALALIGLLTSILSLYKLCHQGKYVQISEEVGEEI